MEVFLDSMKTTLITALVACLPCLSWLGTGDTSQEQTPAATSQAANPPAQPSAMKLGAFSVSLAVKDLAVSRDFYAKLGFEKMGGDEARNYLILKNGTTIIGLFQGMFEDNILTFNPGWDENAKEVNPFTDVRKLQAILKEKGINPVTPIDANSLKKEGPASFVITDPDGNAILIDQHR